MDETLRTDQHTVRPETWKTTCGPSGTATTATVMYGDALSLLAGLPDQSVHAVVTDPPYAVHRDGTMLGQVSANYSASETHSRGYADNDPLAYERWCRDWLSQCLRILKPGGHLVAFGGTRTFHRLGVAAESAGFEIRDQVVWCYGTGVPKGLNLTDADGRRIGRGTTLKPAHEPAVLARRPLDPRQGTVARTFAEHGTGTLNIDGCRIGPDDRWPSNVFLDEHAAERAADAARYFFIAKPSTRERPRDGLTTHPTVKPLGLMRELVRLVTAPGQTILDPFAGSGTTLEAAALEGVTSIGIERERSYLPLIEQRLTRVGMARVDPPELPGAPAA